MKIFTIGHSTRSLTNFLNLLQTPGVNLLADVRRFPHSRRQPQFNIETLPKNLAASGIQYRHMEALGGRRPTVSGDALRHSLWRESSLRNYAAYAETPAFAQAFDQLLKIAAQHCVAIMCAEALWRQCHRRIITDYLLASGVEVEHIMEDSIEKALLTEGAHISADTTVSYREKTLFG